MPPSAARRGADAPADGLAPGTYAAGASLWESGVQNGGLETAEAAFVRLWLHHSKGA